MLMDTWPAPYLTASLFFRFFRKVDLRIHYRARYLASGLSTVEDRMDDHYFVFEAGGPVQAHKFFSKSEAANSPQRVDGYVDHLNKVYTDLTTPAPSTSKKGPRMTALSPMDAYKKMLKMYRCF